METYQIPISVKAIIFEDSKVWLRKNERNEWELPGGKLEKQEQPEQTVVREIKEELDSDIEIVEIIQAHVYQITKSADEQYGVMVITYLCKLLSLGKNFETQGEAGTAEFKKISIKDIPALKMPSFYKDSIEKAWNKLNKTL